MDEGDEDVWRRKTFLPVLDQVMSSLRHRFTQNEDIFSSLALFVPKHFEDMLKNHITAGDLEKQI